MIRTAAGRTVVAFVAAFTVSALGVLLVVLTGSLAVGWILVPGGMLALDNMKMNEAARLWSFGEAVANVALWTFIVYVALDVLNGRRRRHERTVA